MQRDQKVGLALGVLLIGTVAAFFFRNETYPARKPPTLGRASEVDREIAEKELTPYFAPQNDAAASPDAAERIFGEATDEPDLKTGERRLPSWDEIQANLEDPFAADSALDSVPAPAPDPIQVESPVAAIAEATAEPPPGDSLAESAVIAAQTIHEVKRGETLSSIAGKYLGSHARFHEIFVANRDQLRNANDLQIGMKLRIPEGKTVVQTASLPDNNGLDRAELPATADSPKPKFTPAKRWSLRGTTP